MMASRLLKCMVPIVVGFILSLGLGSVVRAQSSLASSPELRLTRDEDEMILHAQTSFELPIAVEEALQKGVALFFVVEAEINRDRWYWYDKKLALRSRHYKLLYQPLIRKWRLYVSADNNQLSEPGMSLPQTFERLPDALSAIGRTNSWRLLALSELEPDNRYTLSYRFKLDTAALPKPLQIGLIGQSDWSLSASKNLRFTLESLK